MRIDVAFSVYQAQKDALILERKNIELVSNSASLIQQAITIKKKATRTFLMASMFLYKEQYSRLVNKI